jgi:hypothetical protein
LTQLQQAVVEEAQLTYLDYLVDPVEAVAQLLVLEQLEQLYRETAVQVVASL